MTHAIRHDSVLHHRRYWPLSEGERARHASYLLLLVGVPGAALGWQLWSHVVVGPGPRVHDVRYDGWAAVMAMLPASLLVAGVAVAAMTMAAKACVVGVGGAQTAFRASTAGLLVVLAVLGTTSADDVLGGASSATEWLVRGAAVIVTGVVALAVRWWAREAGG